jgi:hypothetical protein
MKRFWTIAGIATLVAVLGLTALGAVTLAQDGEEGGWPFDFHGKFKERVAELLGVPVDKYDEAVQQAQQDVVDQALEEGWLTEDQAEHMRERVEQGVGPKTFGFRDKGFAGPRGGFMGHGGGSLFSLVAEELDDMTVEELLAELQGGKSIADLLSETQLESVKGAYLAQMEENLNQAVTEGKMTQNQADFMLEKAGEMLPEMLDNTWEGHHPGGFPGGGRPGRMRGFPGQTDA